jgi:hypothetical protein
MAKSADATSNPNKGKSGILLDRRPQPQPSMKAVGGGQDDRWNNGLAIGLLNALPAVHRPDARNESANATIAGLADIKPSDPVEGMLVGQMIAANDTAFSLYSRAWNPKQSFEVRTKYLALADKAARTVAVLTEALDRHRGRGQQTVVVKHVTVNADQAVVADQLVTGGGVRSRNDEQPHAQAAIAHAPGSPMPSPMQEDRQPVPIARDAERPVPAARGQVTGATKGK